MNSKLSVFMAGAFVGAFGVFLVSYLLSNDAPSPRDDLSATLSSDGELSPVTEPPPRVPVEEKDETRANEDVERQPAFDRRSESRNAGQSQSPQTDPPEPTMVQSAETGNRVAVPVSEAHRDLLARPDGRGQSDVHAELEAEAEDDGWSYFMEQALSEFIGQHPNASKFVIFGIECRTTLCQIQAVGYDDSTMPDWSRILYDLRSQPWYEFGQAGSSSTDYQGQMAIVTHLHRLDR